MRLNKLQELAQPLMDHLRNNVPPHAIIVVKEDRAVLYVGEAQVLSETIERGDNMGNILACVKEVRETRDPSEVCRLLASNEWIVIHTIETADGYLFSLGRVA